MISSLSIVIPAYREEERIGKTLDHLQRYINTDPFIKSKSVEVIVVAANSDDNTQGIVELHKNNFDQLKLLLPGDRVGKGRDVKFGMMRARGDAIMFMDADMATPLVYISKFLKTIEDGEDIVIGVRNLNNHHDNTVRKFLSLVGNFFV